MAPFSDALARLLVPQRAAWVLEDKWGAGRRLDDPGLRELMGTSVNSAYMYLGAQWGDVLRGEHDRPGHLKKTEWRALSDAYEERIIASIRMNYTQRVGGGTQWEAQVAEVAALARGCAVAPDQLLELSDKTLGLLCATPVEDLQRICAEFHRVWHDFPEMRHDQERYELTLRLIHLRLSPPPQIQTSTVHIVIHVLGQADVELHVPLSATIGSVLSLMYTKIQFSLQQVKFRGHRLPLASSTMRVPDSRDLERSLGEYGFGRHGPNHVYATFELGCDPDRYPTIFHYSAADWLA